MSFALGFDYGLKRIGVATGQTLTKTASPLTTIQARNGAPDWTVIQKLLEEWSPNVVVIGLPLNADGTISEMAKRAKKFGQRLYGRFGVTVSYVNEFETTREARYFMKNNRRTIKQDGKIDAAAACLILERWLGEKND